jgi:hypothetical protein
MAMIDPDHERRRLTEFYSHQTDEQLEETAKQADDLTEIARGALRAELANRALPAESVDEKPKADQTETEFRPLIVVRSYWNLLEAGLAKGALDAAGIESFLFDDNMIRMDWFNANAIGGVKLRVDPQNVNAANQILDECAANVPAGDESDSES